jgi:hypothetical protein
VLQSKSFAQYVARSQDADVSQAILDIAGWSAQPRLATS